jgi:predicted peroxiredoxin
MKNILLFILIGWIVISCNQKNEYQTELNNEKQSAKVEKIKDGVFIHITESYNDAHRVLMPMKMANMMAKDKDVLVYFDIHSVELLVKGAKDLSYADFETFKTYLKQLLDQKVMVMVCPTCLKIAGYKPEDLMDGVKLAQKDKFFDFTKGRIITLDY